ncbi:MAG: hypothetical protein WBB07_27090 [Mycobacterium sp.]
MVPRLVEHSDSNELERYNVREHYTERLVLVAAVCRELEHAPAGKGLRRPGTALTLLSRWMRTVYDVPDRGDIKFNYGLDDTRLAEFAGDMKPELELGATVCDALAMAFTADKDWEYESDLERVRGTLDAYLQHCDT